MRIGVYSNPQRDRGGEVRDAVFAAAERCGITALDYAKGEHFDFVISIGGDGTMLRLVEDCAKSGIPILGVNKGTVGYLTETEPTELGSAFDRLVKRDYILERRALLDAVIDGKHVRALNDIVVMRSGGGRAVTIELGINGVTSGKAVCDGYIACTPTGSTAYSLSAGGSVIAPAAPVISLTPLNAHSLLTRSMVVCSGDKIKLTYCGGDDAAVYADGNSVKQLEVGETVEVTGWDMSALFVRFGTDGFYTRALKKLCGR